MDTSARRELEILNSLAEGQPVSQRALARRLGIALGLTNLYLKRLARKGHIKIRTVPPNRIKYYVTPRGFAEKTQLTYQYMRYSLRLYQEARQALRQALTPLAQGAGTRLALLGSGEAAELAYLTLKELGLEPGGVFDRTADGQPPGRFLGMPVRPVGELPEAAYDRIIVASFEDPSEALAELERLGIARERVIPLGRVASGSLGATASGRGRSERPASAGAGHRSG